MIPQVPPTVLHLTVTGQNYLRYEADITVIPVEGPYLILNSYELSDGAEHLVFDTESGFNIQLKNVGNTISSDGSATLSTESEYVTITDGTINFSTISADDTLDLAEAFAVAVSANVPNMTDIDFTVTINSGDDSHDTHFRIKAYAPSFNIGQVSITEIDGNGNGRPDPGETVHFSFPITNDGNADSKIANVTLTLNESFMQILTEPTLSYNTIEAGGTVEAGYDVYVGGAPSSYPAQYTIGVASGSYAATRGYTTKIGLNVVDFENGVLDTSMWTNYNPAPWTFVTNNPYEGQYCLKSGSINDNEETFILLNYESSVNDSISFYYKVSSEGTYDKMYFYIDNQEKGNWSGEKAWTKAQYYVPAGTHTFKWRYMKDYSVSNGSDCCWIDFVVIPVDRNLSVSAGIDISICEDESAQLNGYVANGTSYEWTTAGDGTFDDATSMTALYTPGAQDIANGGTTLTLTGHQDTQVLTDELSLSFTEEPVATAVDRICLMYLHPVDISIEIENMGTFNGWTTDGTGTFANPYGLQTVYTPSEQDAENIDVILTANYTGCGYKTYQHEITLHFAQANVNDINEAKLNIHPNPTNDVININIDNVSSDIQVVVYNSVGQVVYSQRDMAENGYNSTINLSTLSSGTYILQVRSDESVWTKKVIKR